MKKLNALLATACLVGSVSLYPTITFAKTNTNFGLTSIQQQGDKPDAASEKKAYDAYNAANTEKDPNKRLSMVKEALQLYPKSQYVVYFKQLIVKSHGEAFQACMAPAGSENMEGAFKVVNEVSTDLPDLELNYLLALSDPIARFAKKYDTTYAEKGGTALKKTIDLIKADKKPQGVKDEEWVKKKPVILGSLYQTLGIFAWKAAKNDADALNMFKESATQDCSDPVTHYLIGEIKLANYNELSKVYDALTEEQKLGDEGKAALEKINVVVDEILDTYGRMLAVSEGKAPYEKLRTAVSGSTENFWKFRHEQSTDGLQDFLAKFKSECPAATAAPSN